MPASLAEIRSYIKSLAPCVSEGKIPVYSVLIGAYDAPPQPKGSELFSFYLFTDQTDIVDQKNWQIVYLPKIDASPLMVARAVKSLSHLLFPEQLKVFYIDASFLFRRELDDIYNEYCFGEFISFQHPNRTTLDQEINACLKAGKETESVRNKIKDNFNITHSDFSCALLASGFLGRNTKCDRVREAMDIWFDCIFNISLRDQLSLPYALSYSKVNTNLIPLNIYANRYLIPRPHRSASLLYRLKWRLGLAARDIGYNG